MMKLEKTTLLFTMKLIGFLSLVFLVIVFMNILFNENLELSTMIQIKHKKDKKNKIKVCDNKSYRDIFMKLKSGLISNKIESNLSYLTINQNKYVYYSFALVLGGVLNMQKLVKAGIF